MTPIWPPNLEPSNGGGLEPEKCRVVLRAHDLFGGFVFQTSNLRLKVFWFVGIFAPKNFHLVFFGRPRGRFFLDRQRWWLPSGDFTLPRNFTSLQTMNKNLFQHAILNIYGILTYPSGHPNTSSEAVLGMFLGSKYRTSGGIWMSWVYMITTTKLNQNVLYR